MNVQPNAFVVTHSTIRITVQKNITLLSLYVVFKPKLVLDKNQSLKKINNHMGEQHFLITRYKINHFTLLSVIVQR